MALGILEYDPDIIHKLSTKRRLDMGVSQIIGAPLGVPIIRIIVYWGLYWGSLFWETTISMWGLGVWV